MLIGYVLPYCIAEIQTRLLLKTYSIYYLYLAMSRVYEVTRQRRFLALSETILNWIWTNGWDTRYHGTYI